MLLFWQEGPHCYLALLVGKVAGIGLAPQPAGPQFPPQFKKAGLDSIYSSAAVSPVIGDTAVGRADLGPVLGWE